MAHMMSSTGIDRPGPKGWPGKNTHILVTLFLFLVVITSGCAPSATGTGRITEVKPTSDGGKAWIQVEVLPRGAKVSIDGFGSGTTPVKVQVGPGQHKVRIGLEGYGPLEHTVTLGDEETVVLEGELVPIPAKATATLVPTAMDVPQETPALPDLAISYVKVDLQTGGRCDYDSTQLGIRIVVENRGQADAGSFAVEVNGVQQQIEGGLAAGQATNLWFAGYDGSGQNRILIDPAGQIDESDKDNNAFEQRLPIPTPPPTCTPTPPDPATETPTAPPPPPSQPPPPTETPAPPPPPAQAVRVTEGQVTIPTYPFAGLMMQAKNEALNVDYQILDRGAYDAVAPAPADVAYRTLMLENEYLKLTFLPDLGGRIYEVIFKPTGHNETYLNPVLKPSPWGPPEQGWWLAAGGIEWGLPVVEHGYEWGVPWQVDVHQDAKGATVLIRDTNATDRVRAEIAVRLEPGAGFFTVRPRLENPTGRPVTVSYWTNAMLAPGGRNTPSADLRFVLPHDLSSVTVHSRGDDWLPDYGQRMPWPEVDGTDMSRLGNWNRWLGFFEDPAAGGFVAVYDEGYDEGMVRAFEAGSVPGSKVFATGWKDAIPAHTWTDDGSSYVELHSGPAPTFDHNITVPAGGHLAWTEAWYPTAGMGRLQYANKVAALGLAAGGGQAYSSVAVTRPVAGEIVLLLNGQEISRHGAKLAPGQARQDRIALGDGAPSSGRLTLRLESSGNVLAEYSAEFNLK